MTPAIPTRAAAQTLQTVATCCLLWGGTALALTLTLTLVPVPVLAQSVSPTNISELVASGYPAMDSLGILLLESWKAGKKPDTLQVLASLGADLPDPVRLRYQRYQNATDAAERMVALQDLDYELRDRLNALARAPGYLAPFRTRFDAFDAAQGRLPLHLSLDLNGQSGRPDFSCAGLQPGSVVSACLSATNMDPADPVFQALPISDSQVAQQVQTMFQNGNLLFYAQLEPNGNYQWPGSIVPDLVSRGVVGNQPTRVTNLLLVDKASGHVITTGKVRVQPGVDNAAAAPTAAPARQAPATSPGPAGASDANLSAPTALQEPGPGPAGTGASEVLGTPGLPPGFEPVPQDAPFLDLDKFLSLLSYTVYVTPADPLKVQKDLEALQQKFDRISADQGRVDVIQQKELKQLASKIEAKTRKLELLRSMLDFKSQITGQYGARLISGPPAAKVTYERYHLRDGRDVVVFRGTSGLEDWETDFQLAINPETLAEFASAVPHGGSIAGSVRDKMRGSADPASQGMPEAFLSASKLVQAIVRSGTPASKIILTGHSLGGGLAQYAGIKSGVGAIVTFNTAPLSARLRGDIRPETYAGQIRHYVALAAGAPGSGQGTMDPVSQSAGDGSSLQVVGPQYVVEVCADLKSPDYRSFYNTAQGFITSATFSWMAGGEKYKNLKKLASGTGTAVGFGTASTDNLSSANAGKKVATNTAKGFAAAANCVTHPFLCSAKVVTGGVASVYASATLPKLWTLYSAHRMKNMFDAFNGYTDGSCSRDSALN